jgi:hypothetical protein
MRLPRVTAVEIVFLFAVAGTLAALFLPAVVSSPRPRIPPMSEPATLPPPRSAGDDVQYFPPGAKMQHSREAAAMKAYKAELEAESK